MGFLEVVGIVGGIAAIMSLGVSIGVYKTKIPAMQKEIDELKVEARKDRERSTAKFDRHEDAIGEVEKSIVGIETNVEALLTSSTGNGAKLDQIFHLLAQRGAPSPH